MRTIVAREDVRTRGQIDVRALRRVINENYYNPIIVAFILYYHYAVMYRRSLGPRTETEIFSLVHIIQ